MGMKARNRALMLTTMLAMTNMDYREELFEEEEKRKSKPIKKIRPKNHIEFFYGDNSVWALSKKRADIKARKKGYL